MNALTKERLDELELYPAFTMASIPRSELMALIAAARRERIYFKLLHEMDMAALEQTKPELLKRIKEAIVQ